MSRHIARDTMARMNLAEVLVHSGAQDMVLADLQQLSLVQDETLEEAAAQRHRENLGRVYGYRDLEQSKPFIYSNGTAIIPVHGTLINRFHYGWSYITGYNFIRQQLNAALEDNDVELIVFDVNSYGGEAAGCFELANEIRDARIQKSLLAVVDSNCCSAAYAIASAADKVYVTPSGQAGSIGVIAMHMNMAKMLKDFGIEVTIIAEGDHKADGNPYEALSADVLKEIRASVSKRYGEFIDLVVNNRPQLTVEAVRATESRSYRADEALSLELIDAVKTPTQAVAAFLAELGSDEPDGEAEDENMAVKPEENNTPDAAAQAAADARTAERARVKGIQTHAAAANRPKLAAHLAMETDLSVEAAAAIMANAAEEKEPEKETPKDPPKNEGDKDKSDDKGDNANGSPFKQAMNGAQHPNVGDGGESEGGDAPQMTRAQMAMRHAGMVPTAKKESRTAH